MHGHDEDFPAGKKSFPFLLFEPAAQVYRFQLVTLGLLLNSYGCAFVLVPINK